MTEDDLAHRLWRCLSGRIYLVVVDDLWDIKAWDAVKSSFPDDKNRSRVIFTTRELKVAMDAKSSRHNLRPLFDDESLKLLHIKVFGKDDCPRSFSELGKVIARNCKGLPLSIVIVAGLLASNKTSSSWWKEIAEATSRFVGQECKQVIGYSYKHLPEHLKSCFLYMAIYGEDELIGAKQLRQLWIGEGFVNKSTTKSLRIVSKEYLRDLVDRNLVTAVERTCGGEIRVCRLHDLIGDLCRGQAEEDNFLWLRDGYATCDSSNSMERNLYRMSIQRPFNKIEPIIAENFHSLLYWGKMGLEKSFVEKLKLVQVLHLAGDVNGSIFLNHLVHLRYLSVWDWHGTIPESICNLWNLETFIIQFSHDTLEMPNTIWRMKRLRHLDIPLFELDLDGNDPDQLLEKLQFLSNIRLDDDKIAAEILRRLPNLQKLTCSLVGSSGWCDEVFTIDFLSKLESLSLRSYKANTHVNFPLSLKRVYFSAYFDCPEEIMSEIGKLPCLEVLKLEAYLERWEVEDGQFQKLKCLEVKAKDLEEWNVSFYSFPCLEQLVLCYCTSLEEIPTCFAECPTLQMIKTVSCSEELVRSAILVVQEQKDNGNEIRLLKK